MTNTNRDKQKLEAAELPVAQVRAPLSEALAAKCYAVLAQEAGADSSMNNLWQFASCVCRGAGSQEYRFIGTLGFGGKFWVNDGRLYVSCYPEDLTPERAATIERTNNALADLLRTSASGAAEKAPVRAGGVTGQGEKGSSEADRVGRAQENTA